MLPHFTQGKRALLIVPLALLAGFGIGAVVVRGQASSPVRPSDDEFRQLVLERRRAFGHGDAAAYGRLIAPEIVHLNDSGVRRTRDALLAHVAGNRDSGAQYEVTALETHPIDANTIVVDCEVAESLPFGPHNERTLARELNVFVRKNHRWLVVAHSETPELTDPSPAASHEIADYAGTYEWWPGYQETYRVEGSTLTVRATGESVSTKLQAASGESFYAPGDTSVVVFCRDRSGRVTHAVIHFFDGRLVNARRVS